MKTFLEMRLKNHPRYLLRLKRTKDIYIFYSENLHAEHIITIHRFADYRNVLSRKGDEHIGLGKTCLKRPLDTASKIKKIMKKRLMMKKGETNNEKWLSNKIRIVGQETKLVGQFTLA